MNNPPMPPVADELSFAIVRRLADSPDINLTPCGIETKAKLSRTFLAREARKCDAPSDHIERLWPMRVGFVPDGLADGSR